MLKIRKGGVHPHDNKNATRDRAVEAMPAPAKLYIPLKQHIGEPCAPKVKAGELVKKGQVIAASEEGKAPPIHSSTSGKVIEIANHPHPIFGTSQCIVIESDGRDEWAAGLPASRDAQAMSVEELLKAVFDNGIVGMGGAAFPTNVKLAPPKDRKIDTLIVNGAECEPYLTSDYRIMVERPERVVRGCQLVMKILNVTNCIIGIEDNKPEAISKMEEACKGTGIRLAVLGTRYPQGGEKMMIKVITGREIPSGKLPMDVGCVVQNVGTLAAVADAAEKNLPLIERVVTVSGSAVKDPKNLMVKIGTTFKDVFDYCGGFVSQPAKVIMGGPMMGIAQASVNAPVIKSTSGVLALNRKEAMDESERDCIRCGRCVEACTMRLRPNLLSILSEKSRHQAALVDYDLLDCVECGCCTYVCPSRRNIVHYIKLSKAKNVRVKK